MLHYSSHIFVPKSQILPNKIDVFLVGWLDLCWIHAVKTYWNMHDRQNIHPLRGSAHHTHSHPSNNNIASIINKEHPVYTPERLGYAALNKMYMPTIFISQRIGVGLGYLKLGIMLYTHIKHILLPWCNASSCLPVYLWSPIWPYRYSPMLCEFGECETIHAWSCKT